MPARSINDAIPNDAKQRSEIELHQQRVIEPQPPDAPGRDTRTEQCAHGLVEAGGLADAAPVRGMS